jgi:hypothetical protein
VADDAASPPGCETLFSKFPWNLEKRANVAGRYAQHLPEGRCYGVSCEILKNSALLVLTLACEIAATDPIQLEDEEAQFSAILLYENNRRSAFAFIVTSIKENGVWKIEKF